MSAAKSTNIVWHEASVQRSEREKLLGQKGILIWFTGLSGSGKSTVADKLYRALTEKGYISYLLDGDNLRYGLNSDLGFSSADRKENIRRVKEVSNLFVDAGIITITTFISPFREDRESVRELLKGNYIEVYVKCPIEVCEKRDPKGLYKKARSGEIKDFTGIDSVYEMPENPEIIIETNILDLQSCVNKILDYLKL